MMTALREFPGELGRRLGCIRWAIGVFWPGHAAVLWLLLLSTLVVGVLGALAPLGSAHVVDSAAAGSVATGWLVVLLASLTVPPLLETVQRLVEGRIERAINAEGDHYLIDLGSRMPDLGLLDDPARRENLWQLDLGMIWIGRLHGFLAQGLQALISLAVLAWSVSRLDWFVAPLLLVMAVPDAVVRARSHRMLYNAQLRNAKAQREAGYCLEVASQVSTAREVRGYGLADWLQRRHDGFAAQAAREVLRTSGRTSATTSLYSLLYVVAVAGILWFGGQRTSGAGELTLLITATLATVGGLEALARVVALLWQTTNAIGQVRDFDAHPTIAMAEDGIAAPAPWASGLTLRGVSFGYDPARPVLDGLDLHIPSGKVVALVGENGEGKSTLVRLLTRMNDPQSGEILLDGRPLAEYDLTSFRDGIATIFQDHTRLTMTVTENVALGDGALLGDLHDPALVARVERAIDLGGAAEVLADLDDGIDSELGREFGGQELSGGQWQRIATARAFFPESSFVILDEPTSAIDADAERRLFDRFAQLVEGRTALMISHRFSTVRRADVIAVLHQGRIAELGTHEELMALGGRYHELFRIQASRYQD